MKTQTMRVLCGGVFFLSSLTVFTSRMPGQEAEVPPVSTDRPSQGFSPDLVPAGSLQFENGTNVTFQKNQYVADLPENLVRYGVTKHLELRVLSSNLVYRSSAAPTDHLFESQDIAVSAKAGIEVKQPLAPKTVVFALGIPTGGKDFTSGSFDPTLAVIWEQVFHGNTLIEEPQATLTTVNGARRPVWAPSILEGRALTPLLSLFVEYAPSILPDNSLVHVVDGGLIVTRGLLRQFDVRTGYLRDANGTHTLISVGYSLRGDHFLGRGRSFEGPR